MRTETLSAGKGGISRLRIKGGASKEVLYDLKDAYRTASQTIVPRPGSRIKSLVPGTLGLCVFEGKMVVFADAPTASPGPSVVVEILTHPKPVLGATLLSVPYAKPFLGFLYVVASWSDQPTVFYHYWLQRFEVGRKPFGFFPPGTAVQPTNSNGFGFVADRFSSPNPVWKAGQVKAVADRVDPTDFAGYALEVVDTFGSNPATGTAEPAWPAIYGDDYAVIIEETGTAPAPVVGPVVTPPHPNVGGGGTRYDNMGGSDPRRRDAVEP